MQTIYAKVQPPYRRTKKRPLSKEQKTGNIALASRRVIVEHMISLLKRFKTISDRYGNRRKKFGLRFNLIARMHNLEL
jgi:hypothetical protein